MIDNLKPDGTIEDYGIISGARYVLENESIVKGIFESNELPQSYRNPNGLTILGGDTLRGTSRAADFNCALFSLAFSATKKRQELPSEEFNYFTFAESLGIDISSSQAINRHFLPNNVWERIQNQDQNQHSSWYQFTAFDENTVQLFNFHSGYAYGGRRNHLDQRNAFGPTDCSEWIALLFKPEIANIITTGEFMLSADRQENGRQIQSGFDDFFRYVPVSESEPLVAGDILCKRGHVCGYLGLNAGEHITISAARNRGSVIGQGIDGIGITIGDPMVNLPVMKRFKIQS